MQKKIIALAIAAALTAPAAFADTVKVYGKVDLAVGSVNNGVVSSTQMSSQVSKIGFKGAEDLGGGTSAIWQIEQQIDINNAGKGNSAKKAQWASRNSFLGLKSDSFGTIKFGRHDTPYKTSTRHLDVFGDQFADNRHLMGGSNKVNGGGYMDMRPTNEILYVTPNMNGFKATASYALTNDTTTTAAQIKGNLFSLNGVYSAGPIYAAMAYQSIKYSTAGAGTQLTAGGLLGAGDTLKAFKVGGGYWVMDSLRLVAVYEKLTSSGAVVLNQLNRTDWNVGAIYKFGSDDVKFSYTKAGNVGNVANSGAKMIGVGYDHNMSKATSLYVQYNKLTNDSAASFGFNGSATSAVYAASGLGANMSGLLMGMKHSF